MPKIVNHEEYKKELAAKAAKVFSKYGYSNLGMRKIAEEIGISKSAIYHYFSTKEELFAAASNVFLDFSGIEDEIEKIAEFPLKERIIAFFNFAGTFEKIFPAELSLLLDYLHDKNPSDIQRDENMSLAVRRFLDISGLFVGEENASFMFCLIQGVLLQRYFDGQKTSFTEIQEWIIDHLDL